MKPRPLCHEALSAVLDQWIRPLLALDEAEVEVERLDDTSGTVHLRLVGRYRGCPGRHVVFEQVMRPILERELAGLKSLRLVD